MADSRTTVESLSLEEKVGQLFHVGIGPGTLQTAAGWPGRDMQRVVEEVRPGALRFYGTHPVTAYFLARYANQLQRWAADTDHGLPLLISSDCEYGTVELLRHGAQSYPSLMGRSAMEDPALVRDVSEAIAAEMVSMGVNTTHQPVVDVNTNPNNPIIGVRSPGTDPETVATTATAVLEGIHAREQIAVAKHFPGHGDTESDSHHGLPRVTYDRETFESDHLRPFERLIDAGLDGVMTAHVVLECLDPDAPATLSRAVLTDLLRDDLGFDGLVITDSMAMDAIADEYTLGEGAVRTIAAGADLVLTGRAPAEEIVAARDAVLAAVDAGELTEERLDESVERILRLKERYLTDRRIADPLEALETTLSDEHEQIARTAYERSVTVVGSGEPLPLTESSSVLLTGVRGIQELGPHLDAAVGDVVSYPIVPAESIQTGGSRPTLEPESIDEALETLGSLTDVVDCAVVTTFTRDAFPEGQREVVANLASELPVVVVSFGLPNEFEHLPDGVTYVATYAQERLGRPSPFPPTACDALVERLRSDPDPTSPEDALLL